MGVKGSCVMSAYTPSLENIEQTRDIAGIKINLTLGRGVSRLVSPPFNGLAIAHRSFVFLLVRTGEEEGGRRGGEYARDPTIWFTAAPRGQGGPHPCINHD